MTLSALLLAGPLSLSSPSVEVDLLADRAQVAEAQRCLAAEQRVRVRRGDAPEDRWWPFATQPLDAAEDAARCGLGWEER